LFHLPTELVVLWSCVSYGNSVIADTAVMCTDRRHAAVWNLARIQIHVQSANRTLEQRFVVFVCCYLSWLTWLNALVILYTMFHQFTTFTYYFWTP